MNSEQQLKNKIHCPKNEQFSSNDIHNIIEGFLGIRINYKYYKKVRYAFTKKVTLVKLKLAVVLYFVKNIKIIRKLGNGNEFKEIAIAYLLRVYRGPNRKR